MKEIPLAGGLVAIVDDDDFALVSQYRWHIRHGPRTIYAVCDINRKGEKRQIIRMHRLIMGKRPGLLIDHKNGNGLDNRRANLRWATPSQNCANRPGNRNTSSEFKGVAWDCRKGHGHGRWRAYVCAGGKMKTLGWFDSEEDAARAHDVAAREAFGEFAWLNFPESMPM